MIEIKQVQTAKQRKQFVEFPLKLYKNNAYFAPPLYGDEMSMFKKNYMYNDQAASVFFLAYEKGKVVGRIQGIIQRAANQKWGQNRARFTRFDAINDQRVADALFGAVEAWAKGWQMTEIAGPLGYSDNEREGLLIEGFDQLSTFEEQYNYDYYQSLIENCGYGKEIDWLEHKLKIPQGGIDPRIEKVSSQMMQRYNLHFGTAKNTKQFIKKYADQIFEVWDKAYDKIYGTVPFTERVKKAMLAQFNLVLDMRFIHVIVDENDKMVAFGFGFPNITKALQKSGGRLTIPCIVKLLRSIKKPRIIDLAIIGVVDEYKNKGIATALLGLVNKMLDNSVEHLETNLNLEDNHAILNMWKNFDCTQHKRRRCFIKSIADPQN